MNSKFIIYHARDIPDLLHGSLHFYYFYKPGVKVGELIVVL